MAADIASGPLCIVNGRKSEVRTSVCLQDHICRGCGKTFRPKKTDRRDFCSRECYFASKRKNWPSRLVFFPICGCGATFAAKTSRALKCRECQAYRPRPRVSKPCLVCGTAMVGVFPQQRRCGECSKRQTRKLSKVRRKLRGRKNERRLRKHKHRARHYGVDFEAINPTTVFDRDGWRCQICKVRTPKLHRGTNKPTAPELDHIVPISLGGAHAWANVQCSCRSCNGKKGATVFGQLNLIPMHAS